MADDRYERTTHDGKTVDKYTDWNLYLAEERLGYPLTIVQGSYHAGVGASAGTHDGGGVVDLLSWDWERKVRVLRELGFAAWHRTRAQGFSMDHIHAVLLGNEKASTAAKVQMDAYRRGRNGLANNGYDTFWRPNPIVPARYKEATVTLPSDILDLSIWKLQANGVDIKQPALDTYSTWHMNVSGEGVAFRAKVSDNTTSGSHYPRSELREMKPGGTTVAKWSTYSGAHSLEATVAIGRLPKKRPIVVFGQVHDGTDDVVRLVAKRRSDGAVDLIASYGLGVGNGSVDKTMAVVNLGQRFTFKIRAASGYVHVLINGAERAQREARTSSAYFKTGCYVQSNTDYDAATEYGGVVIYKAKVVHA